MSKPKLLDQICGVDSLRLINPTKKLYVESRMDFIVSAQSNDQADRASPPFHLMIMRAFHDLSHIQ